MTSHSTGTVRKIHPLQLQGVRGLLCQSHPNMANASTHNTFCLVDRQVEIYFLEENKLFKVADIFKACEYKWDVSSFYNRYNSICCKSWRKGPKSCWYCDVDDLCDIASRTDEGKKWLARMVDEHVNGVLNRYVILYIL